MIGQENNLILVHPQHYLITIVNEKIKQNPRNKVQIIIESQYNHILNKRLITNY